MAISGTLTKTGDVAGAAARIAIKNDVEPGNWDAILARVNTRSSAFSNLWFQMAVGGGVLAGLFGTFGFFAAILSHFFPYAPPAYLAVFIMPPGMLVGAAVGQLAGNYFMRTWFGIDEETRRGFATRLTLGRTPEGWPLLVKRWLFTGDWLKSPVFDPRLPYVRIFVSGAAPESCAEEDALWREIHCRVSGDSLWEAGANHREISYPQELPGWARKVEPGDGVEELDKRLGKTVSRQWLSHLWRRACKQWPLLGSGDYPADARRECFEAHHLYLSGEREALLVVLRPTCFAADVGDGVAGEESLAA